MIDFIKPSECGENQPYAFISYAHANNELVQKLLAALHARGCRFWYDQGIRTGISWGQEVSMKLLNSSLVIFLVSRASLDSENVKDELYLAKKNKLPIFPVYIENVELVPEIELFLGRAQAIVYQESDTINEVASKLVAQIDKDLIENVKTPVYAGSKYSIFDEDTTTRIPDNNYCEGEYWESFNIISVDNESGEKRILKRFQFPSVLSTSHRIKKIKLIKDDVYESGAGDMLIIKIAFSFEGGLFYPVNAPYYDIELTIAIVDLETTKSKARFLDCRILQYDEKDRETIERMIKTIYEEFTV